MFVFPKRKKERKKKDASFSLENRRGDINLDFKCKMSTKREDGMEGDGCLVHNFNCLIFTNVTHTQTQTHTRRQLQWLN